MINNFLGIGALASIAISVAIISIFLWIWALIDCISSKRETSEKIIWILIIIFLNVLGAIIYLAFNFSKKDTILETSQKSSYKAKGKAKRLFRSRNDKVLGGVCGGIADYFNTDPTFIRLAVVLLFFINGSTFLAYLIAWLIIPIEPGQKDKLGKTPKKNSKGIALVFLILGGVILLLFLVAIFSLFFYTISDTGISIDKEGVVVSDKVVISDEGIKAIELVPEKMVYERIDKIIEGLEVRILNSHNYAAYNGYGLEYLGMNIVERSKCEKFAGPDAHLKQNCYEFKHRFYIDTDKLPESVYGFDVSALALDYDIINIEYTELVMEY